MGADGARLFMAYYDVTPAGNFEGSSILNVRKPLEAVAISLDTTALHCGPRWTTPGASCLPLARCGCIRGAMKRCWYRGTA